ncbi:MULTISPECIES: MFS transporter [unclassified Micromonospora]|uniref:MFS transporter n=1 Tax=unclassified Micromonospora TaxID=2617518 RepID=UPI001C242A2D|nr:MULTISPECIES: MFS transporter [unclassified Micromonospora]MBU8859831.1 MFS transporter [Micromonospora sp. WMMB482]MDM4779352.1 MFS transporter [Micromonospora sp. b486]
MYLSTVSRPVTDPSPDGRPRRRLAGIGGTVLALGTVSLITDVSAEMVTAVLPLYLVLGLNLSPLAFGVLDGLYGGATAVLRVAGGFAADRFRRRKLVAGAGYALSAVAKLGLLLAGRSVPAIGAVIAVDRLGKGVRSAPRDALITLATPPDALGRAFGVHRTMDSVGAFLGPLVALAVLLVAGPNYDAVFVASFCVAALAVVVFVLFVRERPPAPPTGPPQRRVTVREAADLLRDRAPRRLVLAAALLGLATVGDGFVYLLLQRRADVGLRWFPLLAVGTSLAYLLLAGPLGALADRIGRLPVVVGGYVALGGTYLLLAGPVHGWPLLVLTLGLYGLFYAATDGVLIALAGPVLPARVRTTGIALVQTGQALAYLVSSVLFGLAWQVWGPRVATGVAAVAVAAALLVSVLLLAPVSATPRWSR